VVFFGVLAKSQEPKAGFIQSAEDVEGKAEEWETAEARGVHRSGVLVV